MLHSKLRRTKIRPRNKMALALKKFEAIETAEKILPFGAKLRLVKNKPFAPEEYLKFEREAEERHEFIDGRIIKMAGESSGTLKGKDKVGVYWAKALQLIPDLHFELLTTLVGVNSITLNYKGARGPSAEVFHFNLEGKDEKAFAHYA